MSWTHLEDVLVKRSRKPHECFLCGEPIEIGASYIRRGGISDAGPDSFAMHVECEAVSKSWDQTDWECFEQGSLVRGRDETR